jgi:hypothetical protein
MMMYNTQDALKFWILSIVRNSTNKKIAFRKLNLFLSSGERKKAHTLLGHLERANFNQLV